MFRGGLAQIRIVMGRIRVGTSCEERDDRRWSTADIAPEHGIRHAPALGENHVGFVTIVSPKAVG